MKIGEINYQSLWLDNEDDTRVMVIDQRQLPFNFETVALTTVEEVYSAINNMTIRGAPLIGVAGAFGIYLAMLEIGSRTNISDHIRNAANYLKSARPTAVNLEWAVNLQLKKLCSIKSKSDLIAMAKETALIICNDEKESCYNIGINGLPLIEKISSQNNGEPVNILTHCNAGWLACIDYGTATAPIYLAHDKGIPLHIWVDETRPRNQGARLTAYELGEHGVPHTLITDNGGGYLMQKGEVDMVIVGSDRTAINGDVANKTGTYLKALAAKDNNIPFYVALPTSSIDPETDNGIKSVIIEERSEEEVTHVEGLYKGDIIKVSVAPEKTRASNYGFDITPSNLITALVTEKGVIAPVKEEIKKIISYK